MRASSVRTGSGSMTSIVVPKPASCSARPVAVWAATTSRAGRLGLDPAMAAEAVAQDRDQAGRSQDRGRHPGPGPLHLVDDVPPQGVEVGALGPGGRVAGDLDVRHAVDPEGPPAPVGARHQIPDVVLVDQAPRVDHPDRGGPAPARVAEPHAAAPHDRVPQGVDQRPPGPVPLAPARRVDHHGPGRGLGVVAEGAGQRGHQLAQRGPGLGDGAGHGADQGEQGPGLAGGEPGEVGAGAAQQRPAPAPAGLGVDGHARGGQGLEVAAGGGDRHLELRGQFGRGHPRTGLQDEEGGHEAVGAHGSIFARKVVTT